MSFNDYFKQDEWRKNYEILKPVLSISNFLFNIVGCQMWVAISQLNYLEHVFKIELEFEIQLSSSSLTWLFIINRNKK